MPLTSQITSPIEASPLHSSTHKHPHFTNHTSYRSTAPTHVHTHAPSFHKPHTTYTPLLLSPTHMPPHFTNHTPYRSTAPTHVSPHKPSMVQASRFLGWRQVAASKKVSAHWFLSCSAQTTPYIRVPWRWPWSMDTHSLKHCSACWTKVKYKSGSSLLVNNLNFSQSIVKYIYWHLIADMSYIICAYINSYALQWNN